jgi:hypothetical protein
MSAHVLQDRANTGGRCDVVNGTYRAGIASLIDGKPYPLFQSSEWHSVTVYVGNLSEAGK